LAESWEQMAWLQQTWYKKTVVLGLLIHFLPVVGSVRLVLGDVVEPPFWRLYQLSLRFRGESFICKVVFGLPVSWG